MCNRLGENSLMSSYRLCIATYPIRFGQRFAGLSPEPAGPTFGGDSVLAHRDRFDPSGMERYQRIKAHMKEHKVGYAQAMEAVV